MHVAVEGRTCSRGSSSRSWSSCSRARPTPSSSARDEPRLGRRHDDRRGDLGGRTWRSRRSGTYFGRNLNHRRWYWKLFGLVAALIGIGLCLGFNLGVAHLRDALERGLGARGGAGAVVGEPVGDAAGARELPLGAADAGGHRGGDRRRPEDLPRDRPLPGLSGDLRHGDPRPRRVRGRTSTGRSPTSTPAATPPSTDLRDANQEMRLWIREAVDALYGQSSLRSELDRFIEHCDDKANALLAVYRDANRRGAAGGRPGGAGAFQRPLRLPRNAPAAADGGGARRRDPRAEAGERAGLRGDRGHRTRPIASRWRPIRASPRWRRRSAAAARAARPLPARRRASGVARLARGRSG